MKSAILAASAVVVASFALAAPASAQGLSFPLPGQESPPSAPSQPYKPAVSPFQTETLSEQWNPTTNPPQAQNRSGNCKDAATKMAEQSPTPPTPVACY